MRVLLSALLTLLIFYSQTAYAPILGSITSIITQSDRHCEAITIDKEAANQGVIGQRAVLDVVRNRARLYGRTACQVVVAKGQFQWAKHAKTWQATAKQLARLDVVATMCPVVPADTVWFRTNHFHRGLGRAYRRIGAHYFSRL